MNGKRFIALIAKDAVSRSAWERANAEKLTDMPGFERLVAGIRLTLVTEIGAALRIDDQGFVVGTLFERNRSTRVHSIEVETSGAIIASHGDRLVRAYWGSYVAFLVPGHRDAIALIRSPLGDLPCYTMPSAFGLFAASDIDLLRRFAGFVPRIDWPQLALHLAAPDLRRPRTCLTGLDELSGGDRLIDFAGRRTIEACWTPWDFVGADNRFRDPAEAAYRVRDAVNSSVAAQAGGYDKVLLRLSGGLDSSILAAALTHGHADFTAHTLVTRDRGGDERVHARCVANHLDVALVEIERDLNLVDIGASGAEGLPRPSVRAFAQASSRIARDAARACGATVIFDGGGGDNLFASLQSTAPVADCLRADGGVGHFWETARSIGIAAYASTYKVARGALIRAFTRGPAFRWPLDLNLLSDDGRQMAASPADHPWLVPPPGALAGSAGHIALIAAAQSVVQSRDPRDPIPDISPLISQPVAETCLRVPSWFWTRDGHNRVIARDAFRSALPQSIINRRDKGAPDSFMVELIDANLAAISVMLSEGLLARNGLLDREAVLAALAPAALVKGFGYIRIMQLVDVEAWVRSWGEGW